MGSTPRTSPNSIKDKRQMCDRVHYDELALQIQQVQTNQFRLHEDIAELKADNITSKRTIENLLACRSTDITERTYQWKTIQESMALTQKIVAELQKYILGNGTVENSMVYLLRQVSDRLNQHLKETEKSANRTWDVLVKVLGYLAVAAVTAILSLIYAQSQ